MERLKKWLKENGKNSLGKSLDFIGENTSIPVLSNLIENVGEKILQDKTLTEEQKKEAAAIIQKEKELLFKDRQSARNREIEIAKTGKKDFLMYAAGITALSMFVLMVVSVIFFSENINKNPLFHQLMGIIESISLSVFYYYFVGYKK